MMVPRYWSEARVRERTAKRQLTVRRFGWSDTSEADAQAHAESRARDAMQRILAGQPLNRREPKMPYNGAEGVPIREEIVSEHDGVVVTRNSYGALCLNTPNVLFADLDFEGETTPGARQILAVMALLLAMAVALGAMLRSGWFTFALVVLALVMAGSAAGFMRRMWVRVQGGAEQLARKRIDAWLRVQPQAHLRLYRTPAGLRVLAMHRTFDPREPAVAECFKALRADPIYARMCANQNCFRARVSAKPWRIGIGTPLRPRPGVWPIQPERMPARRQWIETYEASAQGYAACRYIESLGPPAGTVATRGVQVLHDDLCRAASGLPIA